MPTRNRSRFVARSIDYFLRQDYPNKELIILEDGQDCCAPLVPRVDNIVYVQDYFSKQPMTIGEKRNRLCGMAFGDLIAHWDDDDWHSPRRLSTQIEQMRLQGARLSGANKLVFSDGARAWLFQTPRRPWLAGGTLVYERSLWEQHRFMEVSDGEDTAFVDAVYKSGAKVAVIEDESLYVAVLHDSNTTRRDPSQWGGFDAQQVRRWVEG